MNGRLNTLLSRRSVRRYTQEAVSEELIRDILEAAMAAPSAVGKDPWEFLVIRNQQTRDDMSELLPNGKMLSHVPVGMLVCGNLEKAHEHLESYMIQDCSAAIENALLAASMLGLGACWLGVHPRTERITGMRKLFGLPDHIVPIAAIALGWPDEIKAPRTRYDPAVVHFERYNG